MVGPTFSYGIKMNMNTFNIYPIYYLFQLFNLLNSKNLTEPEFSKCKPTQDTTTVRLPPNNH